MKKETVKEMQERHSKEIESLQKECKHKKISKWMPSMWAPGHFGPNVRTCENCGMVVKTEKYNIELIDNEGCNG